MIAPAFAEIGVAVSRKWVAVCVALVAPWVWLVVLDRLPAPAALSVRWSRRDRAVRQRRYGRGIPLALLVPVAFAPDWIEWFARRRSGHDNRELSHSLVSVAIGATLVALGLLARARGSAATRSCVWLLYASHWAADFITGLKPTWPGGPTRRTRCCTTVAVAIVLLENVW